MQIEDQKIEDHRRRWCEHLNRMPDIRLPVAALGYYPIGKLSLIHI